MAKMYGTADKRLLRKEDKFDKRAEKDARIAGEKARKKRIKNMSLKERLEIFHNTGLAWQGPARAANAGRDAYRKSKEKSYAQRHEGEINSMYSSKGIRTKNKHDGMKPCVKGNCGQKSLTGKTYGDYK